MYAIDSTPVKCYTNLCVRSVVPTKSRVPQKPTLGHTLLGYFCAFNKVGMSEKSSSPLNNPPAEKRPAATSYPCPYCKWVGRKAGSLDYHLNRYHEAIIAAEGEKARAAEMAKEGKTKYPESRPFMVLAMCPQCWGINKLVLDYNNIRRYSKCQSCGEVILTITFYPSVISNDMSHPIF